MDLIGLRRVVYYRDAGGRGEVKHGFGYGEIFLPAGEAEFGFQTSRLADDQAHEVGFGVGFEEDFADFLIGVGGFSFGCAAENIVSGAGWVVFGIIVFGGVHDFDAAAEFGEIGLSG